MSMNNVEIIISSIDDKYIMETAEFLNKKNKNSYKFIRSMVKIAACIAIVFVAFVGSLSAATASGIIPAYDVLYALYPELANELLPINKSCEDNGIKMEVESVYIHDDTADIYISMQDLTGNRIDETIDLFDSYDIHTRSDQMCTCSLINYDDTSKTATFLINVQHMNGEKISDSNMTFSVSQFLSGKITTERKLNEISLKNLDVVTETQTDVNYRGGKNLNANVDVSKFLVENENQKFMVAEGATVTAYGFIDNYLHIQVYYEDILHYDNHGWLYVFDSNGREITVINSTTFWDEEESGSYQEYVFDIGPDTDLSEYTVEGYFVTCNTLTTGDWKVTFPIRN